jgi:hypothetical protein
MEFHPSQRAAMQAILADIKAATDKQPLIDQFVALFNSGRTERRGGGMTVQGWNVVQA